MISASEEIYLLLVWIFRRRVYLQQHDLRSDGGSVHTRRPALSPLPLDCCAFAHFFVFV